MGLQPYPQLPMTSVVTPCMMELTARGSTSSVKSEWLWMSMNPGATTRPSASRISTSSESARSPMSTMRPSYTATSALNGGRAVPSTTVPPRTMQSVPVMD